MPKSLTQVKLDNAINYALTQLENYAVDSDEYAEILARISKLEKMKEAETPPRPTVSPDTLALCLTNLMGIFMIIRHEQVNVIASKALGSLMRTR